MQTQTEAQQGERVHPQPVNTADAALIVGLSKSTLETMRSRGGGPPYVKTGRKVTYDVADLRAYRASRKRRSTSEETPVAA